MKYLATILQISGALLLVLGVASLSYIFGVILGGAFLIIFGIALEVRGK
jgi:hypothetical protein